GRDVVVRRYMTSTQPRTRRNRKHPGRNYMTRINSTSQHPHPLTSTYAVPHAQNPPQLWKSGISSTSCATCRPPRQVAAKDRVERSPRRPIGVIVGGIFTGGLSYVLDRPRHAHDDRVRRAQWEGEDKLRNDQRSPEDELHNRSHLCDLYVRAFNVLSK
ncbi:MAG: hypothetical protein KY460_14465, partial [Actinobacteria bacterium]|nr:hypothetical protein [Actinomycetota bacterium]